MVATEKKTNKRERISLELDGSWPWSPTEYLEDALSDNDICFYGVRQNNGGIKYLTENKRHYILTRSISITKYN